MEIFDAHLNICMLSREAGSDGMGAAVQSAMASLVYNELNNFSRVIFYELDNQRRTTGREPFLLYPRFYR